MTIWKKQIVYLLLAMAAAIMSAALIELIFRIGILQDGESYGGYLGTVLSAGAAVGACWGLAFGAFDGILYRNPRKLIYGALTGLIWGIVMGGVAQFISGYLVLGSSNLFNTDYLVKQRVLLPVSRSIGWAVVGMALGMLEGFKTASFAKGEAGAIGGFVGGLLGGAVLETLLSVPAFGFLGRWLGLLVLGICIALAIGIAERLLSYAKVRILTGDHRDREFLVSDKNTRVGGKASDQIYLPELGNDKAVHLHIRKVRGFMRLDVDEDEDASPVFLNDERCTGDCELKYGDVVRHESLRFIVLPVSTGK